MYRLIFKPRLLLWFCTILLFIGSFTACEKAGLEASDKEIISFALKQANSAGFDTTGVSVSIGKDTIHINLPPNINLTQLIPEVAITGVSITPASGTVVDFSQPVTFTITAEDGSTKSYVVIVSSTSLTTTLFVGSSNNRFYAIDAFTGSLKWMYQGTNWFSMSSPTYHNGVVYAGCIDGSLYAFDATSGSVRWTFPTGGAIESSPAISDGVVYFGSVDNTVYGVDAANGSLRWSFQTGANASSSPTIWNGMVYLGSDDGYLYALDKNTGAEK
jgi:outer membrane protein assembly factor BamB